MLVDPGSSPDELKIGIGILYAFVIEGLLSALAGQVSFLDGLVEFFPARANGYSLVAALGVSADEVAGNGPGSFSGTSWAGAGAGHSGFLQPRLRRVLSPASPPTRRHLTAHRSRARPLGTPRCSIEDAFPSMSRAVLPPTAFIGSGLAVSRSSTNASSAWAFS
jgi:hypothetical protein